MRAFTLTEMMIATSIYVMVIGGIVYANLIGMKMYELTKAKLGAIRRCAQEHQRSG